MKVEIEKLETVIDKVLFGLESGDDVITVENKNYKIIAKRTKGKGLIEQLQIGVGNNLGLNAVIAKKFRDGIIDGVKAYIKEEEKVVAKIKEVKIEDDGILAESKVEDAVIGEIAEEIVKPTKAKSKIK